MGVMSIGDPYMQWYRKITRLSICSLTHVIGDGFRPAAPVYRTLIEGVARAFIKARDLGVEPVAQELQGIIRQIGVPEQVLDYPPPPQVQRRRGRGGGAGRGRGDFAPVDPDPHFQDDVDIQDPDLQPEHSQPHFNLLTPTQEDSPYIPILHEDSTPQCPSADMGAPFQGQVSVDDEWVEALMEPPSSNYVPAYDRYYVRRTRGASSSSCSQQDVGQCSSMQIDDQPQQPDNQTPPHEPMQRPVRDRRPHVCFTEQQRRRRNQ